MKYFGLYACALLVLLFALIVGVSSPSHGVGIEPVPCYASEHIPVKTPAGQFVLVLDMCKGEFVWLSLPNPPEHAL